MSYINIMSQRELKRNLVLIGILLIVTGIILLLPKAFSSPVPIKSVTITSEKLNYLKKDPGSFNIEKSAEWIEKGKARITFDVDTVIKAEDKYRDIIFVLDISGSMDGEKLNRVKADSIDLINTLLSDTNNRAALITFETESQFVLPLTNNKDELIGTINNLTTGNNTNYYRPLIDVDNILKDYKKEENRDCIVLFLTDGYPNENTPNEEGQYNYLKKQYPYVTINGVQYEMGSDVLEPIKKVSDQQFIADITNLNNVLFEASVAPITYDSFSIIDYINNNYFEIDSVDSIITSVGTTKLEYENSTPKVIWNIENLRSGSKATLTIDVNLKKEYIDKGGLYPTNKKEEIKTEIDKEKEDITSNKTPVLADNYRVIYDGNAPDGCVAKNIPETTTRSVFNTVEISNQGAVCDGYQFKGWKLVTENVKRINDNYFEMPESDVVLRAVWTRVSASKSIDGEIYVAPPSIIKKVTSNQNTEIWKYKSSITKIVLENNISDKDSAIETFDISDKKNESVIAHVVPNDDLSTYTVYIQGNEKVIANQDSSFLFSGFSKLSSIDGLEYFDTSIVTNMSNMFTSCSSLEGLDLSGFDTSQVTGMWAIFSGCSSFTSLDLSSFNTKNVTNMGLMFYECTNLVILDLSNFNTSNVTNMAAMFSDCDNLTSLDVSGFDTSKVTDMHWMFRSCHSLTLLDVSRFDTSKVTNMESMFGGCAGLNILDVSRFDTSRVTNMESMFFACRGLINLDLSNFDTSRVTNMTCMFQNSSGLVSLDLSSFDTGKVISMSNMFHGCSSLKTIDVSSFNTNQVTKMVDMFWDCSSLLTLDLSNFDTSKVTDMHRMFKNCSSLTSLDLSSFNTNQLTDISLIFEECSNLLSVNLSNLDTSKVTNMSSMFSGCNSLISLDLSNFNTSQVKGMSAMFADCNSLMNLDLSSFDTSNVTNMYSMFKNCGKLVSLDLTGFDTSKVAIIGSMFAGCSNLTTSINISSTVVRLYSSIFSGASTISGQIVVNYTAETEELVDKMIETKSDNSNVVKGELIN